jgi:hypothetical protein
MKTLTAASRLAKLALIAALVVAFSPAALATEPAKGPALKELETAAGKKIEDVKVPAVSPPKPVDGGAEVKKSTSSYEVSPSTAPAQGKKP